MVAPVLLHIPHSSQLIPPEYRADYVLDDAALKRELISLTDLYTDDLYQLAGAARAVFPVSRFLVDPERFADDAAEGMAARGMGVLYCVGTQLQPLRPLPVGAARTALLERYYTPHHTRLNEWATAALQQHGHALLIDGHSFPSHALPYELEGQGQPRPQICIGTDPFHTLPELAHLAVQGFEKAGYEVGLNAPFTGALVPGDFYGRDARMQAIMIEIRKDLYVDEATGEKHNGFARIQQDVAHVLQLLAEFKP